MNRFIFLIKKFGGPRPAELIASALRESRRGSALPTQRQRLHRGAPRPEVLFVLLLTAAVLVGFSGPARTFVIRIWHRRPPDDWVFEKVRNRDTNRLPHR